MPRPAYILCCQSQSVDAVTGLISHFSIFNTLQVALTSQPLRLEELPQNAVPWLNVIVSATWLREEADNPEQEYEYQLLLRMPATQLELIAAEGRFVFEKAFHRFDVTIRGQPFSQSGTYLAESRIRRVGDQDWLKQNYPILVEVSAPLEPE